MTNQKPKFRFQGINYLGLLSKQLGDLRGITTLAHELIQNADDAKDESGRLSATKIIFDFRDDGMVVSNDASFREIDFERMQDVAGGSKRSESGARTTGAFGVGFISVYQVTDRPEIHSAGRRWILRPEEREDHRILEYEAASITKDSGTVFKLPWAFEDSDVRQELKVPTVDLRSLDDFVDELKHSLPQAILFLKKINTIELRRNGDIITRILIVRKDNTCQICFSGVEQLWRVIEGAFEDEALELRRRYSSIEGNRSYRVRVAIPNQPLDDGLLFATLPTEQKTGLPFHIDADFYPSSDRRSIAFENSYDYRSEWNRAAIRSAASAIGDNLIALRDMFARDPSSFWAVLESLRQVHGEYRDDERKPFGAFWEALLPLLPGSSIVYVDSGQWLEPARTRIPTGSAEREAVPVFRALGIKMVHESLRRYQNVLTRSDVGVSTVSIDDIRKGLEMRGLTERPQDIPRDFQNGNLLELLWKGTYGVIQNARRQKTIRHLEEFLEESAIAPGLDGRLWPCVSVYQADEWTRGLFADLLPRDRSFLSATNIPLLNEFCPSFTPSTAIKELQRSGTRRFKKGWRDGSFRPAELLSWFDNNKGELSQSDQKKLASIPIFPSAQRLHTLNNLYLPGGFNDPLSTSGLVDTNQLAGLSDFLASLGARQLKFEDYAIRYVPEVFAAENDTSTEDRRKVLNVLARHLGEISNSREVRSALVRTALIECMDYEFRWPDHVYIHCQSVVDVFGELFPFTPHLGYLRNQDKSDSLNRLYRWLGVADKPRPHDISSLIDRLTRYPPNDRRREFSRNVLTHIGGIFETLTDIQKDDYTFLKRAAWLTSNNDDSQWRPPNELYAAFNSSLFSSQAHFIDLSLGIQQRIASTLRHLGVNLSPKPQLVSRHLLECVRKGWEPPKDIYRWLNDNAEDGDLRILCNEPCLRVEGRWLMPTQVYWGEHSFGRFRFQLGRSFWQYQDLLAALNVKELPDVYDAIDVLKEVAIEDEVNQLGPQDKDVVLQCWSILADGLAHDVIDPETIRSSLGDIRCVLTPGSSGAQLLDKPSSMFFDTGYGDWFKRFRSNLISREEHIWTALDAAGVRPLSDVVQMAIHQATNRRSFAQLGELVEQRMILIKSVLENSIELGAIDCRMKSLREIQFEAADELIVELTIEALGRSETRNIPEAAYFDHSDRVLYFAFQNRDQPPWSAIAREMTRAIAFGGDTKILVPAIKTILEANDRSSAEAELRDFGIQVAKERIVTGGEGHVAEKFEEASKGDKTPQDDSIARSPTSGSSATQPQNGSTPADVAWVSSQNDEPRQVEQPQAPQKVDNQPNDVDPADQATPFAELFLEPRC